MEEKEPTEGFKVVDKRRFSAEGEPTEAPSTVDTTRETTGPAAGKAEPEAPRGRKAETLPPVTFSALILDLANTVLFQLGLLRLSEDTEPEKDLVGARRTIDLLGLLEEKTRGNLTDDEKRLITETLYQLRMTYVEMTK
ncbi:MAG: DUF1844 domain-containing protein [Thermodesulfobacteriota bacterium]